MTEVINKIAFISETQLTNHRSLLNVFPEIYGLTQYESNVELVRHLNDGIQDRRQN